jgi:two-component system response regulator PilR (NtrC family)
MRVLVVDDEPSVATVCEALRSRGSAVARHVPAASVDRPGLLDTEHPAVLVLGPAVAERPDLEQVIDALAARVPVVVVSNRDVAAAAVAALKAGAADYLTLTTRDLADRVTAAARIPEPASADEPALAGLVGTSQAMQRVRALVRTAARTCAPVLIEGETGTGKEVVARAIHALGARARAPFIPVNCAAVPETLAESEFFGHARGAFTGALEARPGALRLADGGTLFLDEIEDLPLSLQAKLLRVVQDGEVRPLGGSAARRVDARLVAASNRELWRMVEAGRFRRDLFYRLRVLSIVLPPLRERGVDLPLLVGHFVASFNRRHGTRFVVPPPAQLRPLLDHPWPGNVRELENTLESLLILADAGQRDLAAVLRQAPAVDGGFWPDERARILRVLNDHRWNRQRAAAALGISRVTLWRRMERHGIRDPLVAESRATP